MIVRELIAHLQNFDPELPVIISKDEIMCNGLAALGDVETVEDRLNVLENKVYKLERR